MPDRAKARAQRIGAGWRECLTRMMLEVFKDEDMVVAGLVARHRNKRRRQPDAASLDAERGRGPYGVVLEHVGQRQGVIDPIGQRRWLR